MGQYGGCSPKRHRGFSNNPWTAALDLGVYKRIQQQKNCKVQTVKKYVDKKGQKRYAGTRDLKSTQS
jgi:hypothetical protein